VRDPKLITPLKTASYPAQCIWVDTETRSEDIGNGESRHHLVFGWACYRRVIQHQKWSEPQWLRFTTVDEFWDFCISKCRKKTAMWMFAHNAAYDFTVLKSWTVLPLRGWELRAAVIDSPPFIAYWRRHSQTIRMLDTLNVWKVSLAKIGEKVGLPKLEHDLKWGDREKDDAYGKRDVEIIMVASLYWWAWLKQHDLGGSAATIASQAFKTYRYRFLKHDVLIDDNVTALELARDSYHGGRTEVFRLGEIKGPLYLLDVRSEYPTVMMRENYPTILRGVYGGFSIDGLSGLLERYCVVADVDIETDEAAYPYKASSPLLFPTGSFRTVLTSGELAYALRNNHIQQIYQAAVYDRAPLFTEYIEVLSTLRQDALDEGDSFGAWNLKYLMNSLYGKFGQRGRKSRIVDHIEDLFVRTWDEIDGETGRHYRMRQLAGVIEQHWIEGESAYSHPAIAAHVTGHGRLYLWDLIKTAGSEAVLYCDTDSVLVTQRGYERLKHLTEVEGLGSLHLDNTVERAIIHTLKDYQLDDVKRIKGVRRQAKWIDANTVVQEKWLGVRSLLMRGDIDTPIVRMEAKHLRRDYLKGVVLGRGRVRPFNLPGEAGRWLRR